MNMYGYVGGDPVNAADPTGTTEYSSNRPYWIDNDDEWRPARGPNLIEMAGGHSRDGMGMWDIVSIAGGRHETAAFERFNDAAVRLNQISNLTGISTGCLLSAICTSGAVSLVSGDQFTGGGGGSFGGAGASGSGWGPAFDGLKDHWARHGEELGTHSPDQYYNQAERNIERGRDFRFRIEGQQRLAHITRIGRDAFMFTSTNLAKTRIYTHMRLNQRSLSNIGIALPRGF